MSALKLFVSHSSRLDDVEHKYTRNDRNWQLLEDTCREIRQRYGDRVEVLVDKDGLVPGDDWNHRLNLWLAECHVAIILFSKRAIEKSDWVAKEAAILSWRAELDKDFTLIPVLLDGESTPEDLAGDFFGALQIHKSQCIRNAQTADDILAGIVRKLGEPETLPGAYPQTPMERLQGGIAEILDDKTTAASLCQALKDVGCPLPAPAPSRKRHYAELLARQFLKTTPVACNTCFSIFKDGLSPLKPQPSEERARELFKYIRSLWVEPADARSLQLAQRQQCPMALNGRLISWNDKELDTSCYTLDRFIERAWLGSSRFLAVPLTEAKPVGKVQDEIRRRFLGDGPLPPGPNPCDAQDRAVNRDGRTIVLMVLARIDTGGLPDPALLQDLVTLFGIYEKFMVVFDIGTDRPALPSSIRAAQPRLDDPDEFRDFLTCEYDAFYDERTTKTFLDDKYRIGP